MGRVICRGCGCGWFGACVLCAVWRWVVSCFPHGVGGSYVQQTVDDLENAETEAMMAADEEEGLLCVWNRCSRCFRLGRRTPHAPQRLVLLLRHLLQRRAGLFLCDRVRGCCERAH